MSVTQAAEEISSAVPPATKRKKTPSTPLLFLLPLSAKAAKFTHTHTHTQSNTLQRKNWNEVREREEDEDLRFKKKDA